MNRSVSLPCSRVSQGCVNRSVSDVSDICAEEERKKSTKEKRQKIYKSDPSGKAKIKRRSIHVLKEKGEAVFYQILSCDMHRDEMYMYQINYKNDHNSHVTYFSNDVIAIRIMSCVVALILCRVSSRVVLCVINAL